MPFTSSVIYARATCVFLFAPLVISGLEASAFVPTGAESFRRHSSVPLRATWTDRSFDFSTPQGWEDFYLTGSQEEDAQVLVEWHASVPLEEIADRVPLEAKCLMVGTGLSHLPDAVMERRKASITLQDSSETCMRQLRERYGKTVQYAVGDATKLSDFCHSNFFDMVLDKGLMDAIFCGEGWDSPITALIKESCRVLKTGGAYLLVSYRLPTSTHDFLVAAGKKVGLEWEFDGEGSNDRVGISMARKVV